MPGDIASRIGFLVDGDPDTDLMTALYEHDGTGVRLQIPFLSYADHRSRWWSARRLQVDDLDQSRHAYEPPAELNYFDNNGTVALLDCVSGGSRTDVGRGVGRGTILARYALEGAHEAANFAKLNGFQSEIDGMSYWLAYSAHETSIKMPESGGPVEVTTTMRSMDALRLGRVLNLKAVAIGTAPGGWSPEAAYRSRVFIETFTKTSKDWDDHLTLHFAMRDLIRVASWRPINFQSHRAASLRETIDIRGRTHQQWREVRTATTGIAENTWKANDRFLFYFSDIGSKGISRWLKILEKYERGITPLVRLLDLEGATIDAAISQLGIAVEAIGYQALIESGKTPTAANATRVAERVEHLLTEVSGNLSFTDTEFGQNFANSYNSVKHANRASVAPDVKLTRFHQGVELLRIWIALRLGVTAATLKLRRD